MGGVLPGALDPLDAIRGGVVNSEDLISLGGEIQFASGEGEAVRSAEHAEVDAAQFAAGHEVDHRYGAAGRAPLAVVADEGQLAVARRHALVGAVAGTDGGDHGVRSGVDNRQRTFLVHYQQRRRRRVGGRRGEGQYGKGQGEREANPHSGIVIGCARKRKSGWCGLRAA